MEVILKHSPPTSLGSPLQVTGLAGQTWGGSGTPLQVGGLRLAMCRPPPHLGEV